MSIDFQSAEGVLTRELTRTEALASLRNALREVGSLQQAASETETRIERVRAEEVAAQASLAQIRQQAADEKAKIAEARAAAEGVLAKANEEASRLIAAAKSQAAEIVAAAEAQTADARARAKVLTDAIQKAQEK